MATKLPYETKGTRTDIKVSDVEKVRIQEEKEALEKKRLEKKRLSILPVEEQLKDFKVEPSLFVKKKVDTEKAELSKPEVFTDEAGMPSGIDLPTGETFLGLNREDVAKIAEREVAKRKLPEGTQLVGTTKEQLKLQKAISKIGQVGGLTPAQEAAINWSQALTAGTIGNIGNIA